MDKEISALAEKLAAQVKESGRKKVTILDFTDLQGNSSELGRFLTEELSVGLVERKSGFSVMDRANLKTLLAEHKLTVDGLVDPENAKKLGQFSGVDAIILGKVTPLKDEVAITVKVIATDSAETVGAARGRIPMGKEIEHLLGGVPVATSAPKLGNTNQVLQANLSKNTISEDAKEIAGLRIKVESLKLTADKQHLLATFIFQNTSVRVLGCALGKGQEYQGQVGATILDKSGGEFRLFTTGLTGIGVAQGKVALTEIQAGDAINVTGKYENYSSRDAGGPFRLQISVFIASNNSGDFSENDLKLYNFVIDVPKLR